MSNSKISTSLVYILSELLNFLTSEEGQPLQTSASWKLLSFLLNVNSMWPILMLCVGNERESCKMGCAVSFCSAGAFCNPLHVPSFLFISVWIACRLDGAWKSCSSTIKAIGNLPSLVVKPPSLYTIFYFLLLHISKKSEKLIDQGIDWFLFSRYQKAIQIYEEIACQSLNNNLLKYGVRGHLLNAGLCQLCRGDVVAITNSLEQYQVITKSWLLIVRISIILLIVDDFIYLQLILQDLDPTFSRTREYKFLAVCSNF